MSTTWAELVGLERGQHWRDELECHVEGDALSVLAVKHERTLAGRYELTVTEWRARPEASRRNLTFPVVTELEPEFYEWCAQLVDELVALRSLELARARAWAPAPVAAHECTDTDELTDTDQLTAEQHAGPPGLSVRTRPATPHGPPRPVAEWWPTLERPPYRKEHTGSP